MAITISLVPSRTSGVAPLAVFFDATGTTSTVTTYPFHECHYVWNFGDTGSGTWAISGKSKNVAYGACAAHVYETAGTYTVSLTVYEPAGAVSYQEFTQITVSEPDTVYSGSNTICFSTSGNFTGAPAGATQVTTSTWATIVGYVSSGRRLLFRSGETWSVTSVMDINLSGPLTIGKFGAGSDPKMDNAQANQVFRIGTYSGFVANDIRIMDLEIDGNLSTQAGLQFYGRCANCLALRIHSHDSFNCISFQLTSPDGPHYNLAIVECLCDYDNSGVGPMYGGADTTSIMGCRFEHPHTGSHNLRTQMLRRSVVCHNSFAHSQANEHMYKMSGPFWTNNAGHGGFAYMDGLRTEYVIVSDNTFNSLLDAACLVPGPQDDATDARHENIIIERNLFVGGANSQQSIWNFACYVTIRNNVVNATATTYPSIAKTERRGVEPIPHHLWAYNNTIYTESTNSLNLLVCSNVVDTVVSRNNLGYGPYASARNQISGAPTNLTQSNNLWSVNPLFTTTPPSTLDDFDLLDGSPAIGSGYTVTSVYTDVSDRIRAYPYDVGASAYTTGGQVDPGPTLVCIGYC